MTDVIALILAALALPSLLARLAGGHPPDLVAQLAALAPIAAVLATLGVIVAATKNPWLAVVLAIPAATLMRWQMPPLTRTRHQPVAGPPPVLRPSPSNVTLCLLTVNAQGGAADSAALLHLLHEGVDVFAVQELTAEMVDRLTEAGLGQLLPYSHLDPRPGGYGTGLWARWPLIPLPPVPGMTTAAPRARIAAPLTRPVSITIVHPLPPKSGQSEIWQRELGLIGQTLATVNEPQVVAGDFNASRDHRPFRDLLGLGFVDCADFAPRRSWPGFTWPGTGMMLPLMRLDHVLVSLPATVHEARAIRIPGTDHHGVKAAVEFPSEPGNHPAP